MDGPTDIEEDSDDEESSVEDNYDVSNQEDAHDEFVVDDSDTDGHNENIAFSFEYTLSECVDGVKEGDYVVYTCRHLIGSQGKLLMVKREWLVSAFTPTDYTRKVEVFEANMDVGTWVALSSGVVGGQAIFISNRFSNVVSACGEVEEDIMYFPDTDDVFDMRSGTIRPLTPINRLYDWWKAWVFPPDLVV